MSFAFASILTRAVIFACVVRYSVETRSRPLPRIGSRQLTSSSLMCIERCVVSKSDYDLMSMAPSGSVNIYPVVQGH